MIKNKEVFNETVEQSATTRVDIDVNMRTQYKGLTKAFEAGFLNPGKVFKRIVDLTYYNGGYPVESSPAKFETMVDDFARAINYFRLLGDERIEKRLKEAWGIELSTLPWCKDLRLEVEAFEDAWHQLVSESEPAPVEPAAAMKELVRRAKEVQCMICESSDSIKIDAAEKVDEECSVKRPVFMKAVGIKAKSMKKDDPLVVAAEKDKLVEKFEDLTEAMKELK